MITFLASPKPFVGTENANQRRSVQSWMGVRPGIEIILYGNVEGTKDICAELGLLNVPDIPVSPSGVPYFDAIARHAEKHAKYDLQVFLNADILLDSRIVKAVKLVSFQKFMMVGQRIDLPKDAFFPENGTISGGLDQLLQANNASLHEPTGMDYFVFPRGLWRDLSPLVIGRAKYDSALVAYCLANNIPVIDATCAVLALHQYHDYSHVAGGKKEVWEGADAQNNWRLHRVRHSSPNTADAGYCILDGKLLDNRFRGDWLRGIELYLRYKLKMAGLSYIVRALWRILVGLHIYRLNRLDLKEAVARIMRIAPRA